PFCPIFRPSVGRPRFIYHANVYKAMIYEIVSHCASGITFDVLGGMRIGVSGILAAGAAIGFWQHNGGFGRGGGHFYVWAGDWQRRFWQKSGSQAESFEVLCAT
ncbi:MAG: hypothetical protein ABSA26_08945, partial [Thermoguttaceae bacterium]